VRSPEDGDITRKHSGAFNSVTMRFISMCLLLADEDTILAKCAVLTILKLLALKFTHPFYLRVPGFFPGDKLSGS
jgi:hypothetical protein